MRSIDVTRDFLVRSKSAAVLLLLALGALVPWVLSSPPGASPDDDFHLVSAWCAGGPRGEICAEGETQNSRLVQRSLVEVADCYRFQADVSAACQAQALDWDDNTLVSTERLNTQNLYPPVFYRSMNLLVSDAPIKSIVAMRLLTIFVGIALFSGVFWASPRAVRQALAGSWLLALFPLGIFLVTSNNPSGWAVIGVGTFWAAFLNVLEPGERGSQGLRLGLLVATATVAAGSRADAAVYILISVVAVLIFSNHWRAALPNQNDKQTWLGTGALLLVCGLSLLSFFSSTQGDVATSGFADGPERTISYLLEYNLRHLHILHFGMIGKSWGLGWLDTSMPPIVWRVVGWTTLFAAAWGLTRSSRRKAISVVMVAIAMIAIPVAILVRSAYVVPETVQPRYLFPLYFVLLGLTLLPANRRPRTLPLWAQVPVATAVGIVNAVALHVNTRRYVSGLEEGWFDLGVDREWWWEGLPTPMAFWFLSTVSTFLLALAAMSMFQVEDSTSANPSEAV